MEGSVPGEKTSFCCLFLAVDGLLVGERGPVKESDIRMDVFEICMKDIVVSLVITVHTFLLCDFKVN